MDSYHLARELLKRMIEFEKAEPPTMPEDMGFVRREVAQDFVERFLNVELNPKVGEALNQLTRNPASLRAEFIAPIRQQILDGE